MVRLVKRFRALLFLLGSLVALSFVLVFIRMVTIENGGKTRSTRALMGHVQAYLEEFHSKCGRYPSTEEGIASLFQGKDSKCKAYVPGNLDSGSFKEDAWGHQFIYVARDDSYSLISGGNTWIEATPESKPKVVKESEGMFSGE